MNGDWLWGVLPYPPHCSSYYLIEPWHWSCLYLTLTLCDLTLLVLSWLWKKWNLRLIYETKTCIHHFSRGNNVPPLKDRSVLREYRTFAIVHKGLGLNVHYTSTQIVFWKYQWKRAKYSNNSLIIFKRRHIRILSNTFLLSWKFQGNLLVKTTNAWISLSCLLENVSL